MNYPWYEIVEGSQILQGDFISSCPIILPPPDYYSLKFINEKSRNVKVEVEEYNVIIMSQSCDLAQKKLELVLVCPYWKLGDFESKNEDYKNPKMKENLRKGFIPGYHLLNKCEFDGFHDDYIIVDFRKVFSVSFSFLIDYVSNHGKRLRLLPPYREHLSQAFARFFMRVGLPIDIPPFNK